MKVWKVLIADDEPIIREGIRDSVDWSSLQMDVIAEAEDGEEALELALTLEIDILLVDLNMPIMNGITVIKHIREQLPNCKIVIITGHDEFSYAQEAVRLNVTDYILKPANPEQLKQVIEGVRQELEKTIKQDEYFEMASNQISKNLSILREQFCREWIEGRLNSSYILKQLEFLELPIKIPNHFSIIKSPEYFANKPLMKDKDKKMIMFSIENIVSEILQSYNNMIFFDESGLMNIIIWDHVSEDLFNRIETELNDYLKTAIKIYDITVDHHHNIELLSTVYIQCRKLLETESNVSPIVRRARQFIENHFTDPMISLEVVAQNLQVSTVYLSRMIKQELGLSFVNLVTNMRIKKAIHLLNTTDLPIVEISEQVGYDTQHYFSTAFKKAMGVSPIKYRKNQQKAGLF